MMSSLRCSLIIYVDTIFSFEPPSCKNAFSLINQFYSFYLFFFFLNNKIYAEKKTKNNKNSLWIYIFLFSFFFFFLSFFFLQFCKDEERFIFLSFLFRNLFWFKMQTYQEYF